MTYCKNCSHESHCGTDFKQEARNGRGVFLGEIIVCKYCRCELCEDTKRRKPEWPGPGVQEKKMSGIDCFNEDCKNPLCDCDPCECTVETPCVCCEMWDGE